MKRVGVITQARTTSTRLPGKVLIEVAGATMLGHHLDRLARSGVDVFVATTTNEADNPIVDVARRHGASWYRGSEHDVLSRFHGCATENGLEVVVRVTSDCPLIDGALIADAVREFVEIDDENLYLSNALSRTFPRGFDFEVFSARALAEADRCATVAAHREHVTPYLYEGRSDVRLSNVRWPEDKSGYRVTLDTPEDLEVIRGLIEDHQAHLLGCAQIIELLDTHPEIANLNQHVEQKKLGE